MKTGLLGLVACGALVFLAFWFLLARSRELAVPELQPLGTRLEGPEDVQGVADEVPLRSIATKPMSQAEAGAIPSTVIGTYLLRGVVRTPNASQWVPRGSVEITYDEPYKMPGDYVVTGTIVESGSFEINFSELVNANRFGRPLGTGKFKLRATGEFISPAEATVDLATATAESRDDGSVAKVLWAELVTSLGSRIAGRVVYEDQQTANDAELYVVTVGTQSPYETVGHTSTDNRGEFSLQVPCDQQLVVLAMRKGLMPASAGTLPERGELVRLEDLVLQRGKAIDGYLETTLVSGQCTVIVRRLGNGVIRHYYVSNIHMSVQWEGLDAYWGVIEAPVVDGAFTVSGLEPGGYLVWAGQKGRAECTAAGVTANSWRLEAPATGVVLRDLAPRVTLQVIADGQPVIGAAVTLLDKDSRCPVSTGEGGLADLILRPGEAFEVAIEVNSFPIHTLKLTAPLEGVSVTETVNLRR